MNKIRTIVAISSPIGIGAIGIIRISGPIAKKVLKKIFKFKYKCENFISHHLYYGNIIDNEQSKFLVLDEVMIAFLKAPNSYTGEDTVEIYCHGNILLMQIIIEKILKYGVKLAEPGEFTKKAFLNKKIDLSQAQAVMEIISASNKKALQASVSNLEGILGKEIIKIQSSLLKILAKLEVAINFLDEYEDIEESIDYNCLTKKLGKIINQITSLINSYEKGKIYTQGLRVIIIGKPNVGKSSLFNNMIGTKRAIVTNIPGTTRDLLYENIQLKGIPIQIIDTAGIRSTNSLIELKGIQLVKNELNKVDIILFMFNNNENLSSEDKKIANIVLDKPVIPIINKIDLLQKINIAEIKKILPYSEDPVLISLKNKIGLNKINVKINYFLQKKLSIKSDTKIIISNIRQKNCLERTKKSLKKAIETINTINQQSEIIIFEIKDALKALQEITGQNVNEKLINEIFSTFCLGK